MWVFSFDFSDVVVLNEFYKQPYLLCLLKLKSDFKRNVHIALNKSAVSTRTSFDVFTMKIIKYWKMLPGGGERAADEGRF